MAHPYNKEGVYETRASIGKTLALWQGDPTDLIIDRPSKSNEGSYYFHKYGS